MLKGDKIVAATQEERYSRKKYDNRFPQKSINYCLKYADITPDKINCIAFYEEPYVKLDRLVETQERYSPFNFLKNTKKISKWIDDKFYVEDYIADAFPDFKEEMFFFPHHLSHAASAYYPSPFSEATVLTVDGIGEWSCSSIAVGNGENIEIIQEQRFPHSLGLLYSAFTQYIGFKVDSGEYKLMGLAPYGNPIYGDKIQAKLVNINNDGSICLNTDYFDFMTGSKMINQKFCDLFNGKPRQPEDKITQKEMDIAASIQKVTEDILLKMVKHAVKITGCRNLCMAGGVALNCVANGKILKSGLIEKIWIQPASGDAGGALGAAFLAVYNKFRVKRKTKNNKDKQKGSFLGPQFSNEEIKRVLDAYGFIYKQYNGTEWSEHIAFLLANGKIVALFQGRMEYGPRALGCRSILGDSRNPDMQKEMNLKIKFRESFRPFAPMVLSEKREEWFDISIETPYMQFTADVKQDKRKKPVNKKGSLNGLDKLKSIRSVIPAVTHVDYSARVQTVDKESNRNVYDILKAFEKITGCPVLINTSFNIRGEPIVCAPFDALRCFMNTNIDVLVLEDFVLMKEHQGDILTEDNFKNGFAFD